MICVEYEDLLRAYKNTQTAINDVLMEKERLFTKTQPNAIRYDKDSVQSSVDSTMMESYVIALDEKDIEKRLKHLKSILKDREELLAIKEKELRQSRDKWDEIYCQFKFDGISPEKIARGMGYSKSQIYRILNTVTSF